MKTLKRLITLVGAFLVVGAVSDQLKRPKEERTWQGKVAGVPYDFRLPTPARVKERWWNPEDERLLTPHVFGVGWSVNLYRLWHRCCSGEDEEQKAA